MSPSPLAYRPDIDGLRAFAVLAVIFFHFHRFGCGGGFVGVDVFFVISGFLITSIIAREISAGSYSTVAFYERRIRRLLPALFVVFALSSVAAWFVLLPRQMESFGKSLVSSLALVANFYFLADTNYFAEASDLKPLLHVWSLAVEEQFYLVFPLLLAFVLPRGRSVARTLLWVLAGLSLVAACRAVPERASEAFYLPHLRAWELLMGAIVALGAVPPVRQPFWRNLLALSGLAAIAFSVTTFGPRTPFPGWYALLPCLGTALLIHVGSSGPTWVGRFLGLRPFVGIGLASYSLYLWHWPLLVFTRHLMIGSFGHRHSNWLFLWTTIAGFASWYFVERWPRRRGTRRQVFALAGLASVALAAFGAAAMFSGGLEFRVMNAALRLDRVQRPTTPVYMRQLCKDDGPLYGARRKELCQFGSPGPTPSLFLWGDSHAQGLAPLVERLAVRANTSALVSLSPGCAPLLSQSGECARPVVNDVLADPNVRTVIMHARWRPWSDPVEGGSPAKLRRDLAVSLRAALAHGRRVTLIGPVPEVGQSVPDAYARSLWLGTSFDIRPRVADFERDQRATLEVLRSLQKDFDFTLELPHEALCLGTHCDVIRDGRLLYTDAHHLSEAGVQLLEPMLIRAMSLKP